ncbi:hypothetical protein [Acinetobacter baumannii]|uniref:hypothetical protein n=1 Tax=Acinetobacter baumannii TaxID=470 RepID=UPI0022EA4495|nr:hypothetical protein [Acinetobacter baumannii]MDA3522123.1 hypothetical protein [Acinetobacter baumannii]
MDSYKIKVNDEAESKEAQELFFELGLTKEDFDDYKFPYYVASYNDGEFSNYILGSDTSGWEELTLPQLRDLVVLKRNDVKDKTHRDKRDESIYLTSDKVIYYWQGEWCKSAINKSNDYENYIANSLTPITQPQDPALISGADALRALACGRLVQWTSKDFPNWTDLDITNINAKNFIDEERIKSSGFKYRLKPQTIKLELEIPAPCKAKIGGRDDASFVLNVGRHQYCYNNEEDYTKARDALEAVFDSAVRGTNS